MSKTIESSGNLPHPPPLVPEQRKLIAATVPILAEHGIAITTLFYEQLLDVNPELPPSLQRGHQAEALARAVYAYAANIEDLTPILPVVERITHKHTSLHVAPSHYAVVGKHLFEAITQVVGADMFKGNLYEAWGAAYWNLAHVFINREHELYEAAQWVGWREFVVAKKIQESDEVTSFHLEPKDGVPLELYRPGQYISVQNFVPELGLRQSRQYSLSDVPNPESFHISVKREPGIRTVAHSGALDTAKAAHPGWMSELLHARLAEGDSIEVAFPFGEFFLDDSAAPVILLLAGVGLTPLLAMLNTLVKADIKREVSWVHAVRNERVHAFREHVRKMREAHPDRVCTRVFYSEPSASDGEGRDCDVRGRLELEKVPREVLRLDAKDAQYYVRGPETFMSDTVSGLKSRGVDASRIHAEVFGSGATPK